MIVENSDIKVEALGDTDVIHDTSEEIDVVSRSISPGRVGYRQDT